MFTVYNQATRKSVEVNFEQLKTLVGEELDDIFYTKVFTNHTLTGKKDRFIITGGSHD